MIEVVPQTVLQTEMPRAPLPLLTPHHIRVAFYNSLDREDKRRSSCERAEFASQAVDAARRTVEIYNVILVVLVPNSLRDSRRKAKRDEPSPALTLVEEIVQKDALDLMPEFSKFSCLVQHDAGCARFLDPSHIGSDEYFHR